MMKQATLLISVSALILLTGLAVYYFTKNASPRPLDTVSLPNPSVTPKVSLGNKIETPTPLTGQSDEDVLKNSVMVGLKEKHGQVAANLNLSVTSIDGDYAKGMANETGGGGLWFAAKVGGVWELVWDGNGIIECSSLASYPDFPSSLIPQCFDTATEQMKTR